MSPRGFLRYLGERYPEDHHSNASPRILAMARMRWQWYVLARRDRTRHGIVMLARQAGVYWRAVAKAAEELDVDRAMILTPVWVKD